MLGFRRIGVLALTLAAVMPAAVRGDTTQKLLDLLRERNQISAAEHEELKKEHASNFRVYWDKGLQFGSGDGRFQFRLGARLQNDWAVFVPNDELDDQLTSLSGTQTGVEIRRARIQLEGTFYRVLEFKSEYDFAGGEVALKDVYFGVREVPVLGRLRLGHFKEPFSLEQLTSDSQTTFMERSLIAADAFAPDRSAGIAFYRNFGERLLWAGGGFRESDDTVESFGGDALYNVTTRISGLPWYEDKGRRLLHLGFGYSHKFRNEDEQRFSQRPESHLAPRLVDTGEFEVDGVDLINPELALVIGPFSLQSEYMRAINATSGTNAQFDGFYVLASFFLTGEHRPYKTGDGAFDRPIPRANFLEDGGAGAWEVAARYSQIDLNDEGIEGHMLRDVTLGTNWYLNPYFKVMLNYVYANRDRQGEAHIAQARFHLDF